MIRKLHYYITHWEVWHWFFKYIVIGPMWLLFCLRGKSLWFFTSSNPTIAFGGFTGESKSDIYKQLPEALYPATVVIPPWTRFSTIVEKLESKGLRFPLAVKPDVGMMGLMFRKIETLDQLKQYHRAMSVRYLIQEYVDLPTEVSVFYYRMPGALSGTITGFVRKESMQVIGDGVSTLETLIKQYQRAQFRQKEMFIRHENRLADIIPAGEIFYLSHALNLSRGGRLISLEDEKDDQLLAVFDELSHSTDFFYGRYDIKCNTIDELKNGENFKILEYNGAGAEPHHVYGNGYSFTAACGILVRHWEKLLEISQANAMRGEVPWTFQKGLEYSNAARTHFRRLREMDQAFTFDSRNRSVVASRKSAPAMVPGVLIIQNA